MSGRRRFETRDRSANNYLVAVISLGEGLQNNHHAFPTSARHALRWFEPDVAGWVIGFAEWLGLFWDVKHPSPAQIANKRLPT
jgi:stearoyl-CoA desaturase (delta-9 desaturase)